MGVHAWDGQMVQVEVLWTSTAPYLAIYLMGMHVPNRCVVGPEDLQHHIWLTCMGWTRGPSTHGYVHEPKGHAWT